LHSEMMPLLDREGPNPLELFQIWLNLPAADKMTQPYFTMFWSDTIPVHTAVDDAGRATRATLEAGAVEGIRPPAPPPSSWASRPESDVAIWSIRLAPGARWTLPAAPPGVNRMLYFFRGPALTVAGRAAPPSHALTLDGAQAVPLEAGDEEVELLLLQGRPIGEP